MDAINFGKFYHESLEVFDRIVLAGFEPEHAQIRTINAALDISADWDSLDTARTRKTLVRAASWYCDNYIAGDYMKPINLPDGSAALEVAFNIPLAESSETGEPFRLRGFLDGLVTFGSEHWVRERKTTKTTLSSFFWKRYEPNVQISTYNMAAPFVFPEFKIKGVVVEACQTAVGFARYGRQMFQSNQDLRDEFLEEVVWWVKQAEACALEEFWPKNEASCMLYGGCQFRDVCLRSPLMREPYLNGNFETM